MKNAVSKIFSVVLWVIEQCSWPFLLNYCRTIACIIFQGSDCFIPGNFSTIATSLEPQWRGNIFKIAPNITARYLVFGFLSVFRQHSYLNFVVQKEIMNHWNFIVTFVVTQWNSLQNILYGRFRWINIQKSSTPEKHEGTIFKFSTWPVFFL